MLSLDGSCNIKALNGSGKSSAKAEAENLRLKDIKVITPEMPDSVTIPEPLQDGVCFIVIMDICLGKNYLSLQLNLLKKA